MASPSGNLAILLWLKKLRFESFERNKSSKSSKEISLELIKSSVYDKSSKLEEILV